MWRGVGRRWWVCFVQISTLSEQSFRHVVFVVVVVAVAVAVVALKYLNNNNNKFHYLSSFGQNGWQTEHVIVDGWLNGCKFTIAWNRNHWVHRMVFCFFVRSWTTDWCCWCPCHVDATSPLPWMFNVCTLYASLHLHSLLSAISYLVVGANSRSFVSLVVVVDVASIQCLIFLLFFSPACSCADFTFSHIL